MPKIDVNPDASKDDRFKLGQLVTCIIDPSYDTKRQNKGAKRRAIKKEMKQEAIKEAQEELEEVQKLNEDNESISAASSKAKKSKRTRKSPQNKTITVKKEELNTPQKKIKAEDGYLSEIEKILEYSKKSKSPSDMDFSVEEEYKEVMKMKSPKSEKKKKKMSRFKEYLEWYDLQSKPGKVSVSSKAPSTVLSTPAKISLKISERLARARRAK